MSISYVIPKITIKVLQALTFTAGSRKEVIYAAYVVNTAKQFNFLSFYYSLL